MTVRQAMFAGAWIATGALYLNLALTALDSDATVSWVPLAVVAIALGFVAFAVLRAYEDHGTYWGALLTCARQFASPPKVHYGAWALLTILAPLIGLAVGAA